MQNTVHTQSERNSVRRQLQHARQVTTLRSVRPDNPAPPRARTTTPQPASLPTDPRSQTLQTNHPHKTTLLQSTRKTVQLVLWVRPVVKAELQRLAEQERLSISATGAAFLEKALQQNLHEQHTTLLDTVIDKAIGRHMRTYSNRIAVLLVRSLVTSDVVLSLVTNILGRHPGMTQKDLAKILTASDNKARANITRVTPQLKTFLEAVERQFLEGIRERG
jgi:hypothetical protein